MKTASRVRPRVAASGPQLFPSAVPSPRPLDDPAALSLVGALARFNRALLQYLPQQRDEVESNAPSPQPVPRAAPVQPNALDEITDENGRAAIPTVRPGEKTVMWRYQLPPNDPRYRPLQGRYRLGIDFNE